MKTTMIRPLAAGIAAALLPLAIAPGSFAQAKEEPVATLKQVKGNVLVSGDTGLASGDESGRITKGSRVITTANSVVTVVYDNGCEVKLKPNQRFEVATDKPCSELVASAESILEEPSTALAAAAGGAAAAAGGGAGAAAAGAGAAAAGGVATVAGITTAVAVPALAAGLTGLAAINDIRQNQNVSPS